MTEYSELVLKAALEAGKSIMGYYHEGFSVHKKADASPVTEADKAADQIIRECLQQTGIPVISEENAIAPYPTRKNWKKAWMVDPLDGTKEFIKGTGEFTVNIALLEEGEPAAGLVFAPALGLLYRTVDGVALKEKYLVSGAGVFIKDEGIALSVADKGASENICASVSHANEATRLFIQRYGRSHPTGHLISIGSSLKFCLLAERKAGIYPRFTPTMEWDTAAGHAILNAVGGNVWDMGTQAPIRYNREYLRNGNFIATAPNFAKEEAFGYL